MSHSSLLSKALVHMKRIQINKSEKVKTFSFFQSIWCTDVCKSDSESWIRIRTSASEGKLWFDAFHTRHNGFTKNYLWMPVFSLARGGKSCSHTQGDKISSPVLLAAILSPSVATFAQVRLYWVLRKYCPRLAQSVATYSSHWLLLNKFPWSLRKIEISIHLDGAT